MQIIFDTSAIEQTHGLASFLISWWMEAGEQSNEFLICKLRSKRRLLSDHAGMKNISAEVSIFCP